MNIAIIDYGAGNVKSVELALQRLGMNSTVTDDPEIISSAEKVIFPGVGHAKSAMEILRKKNLVSTIQNLTQPVLGICLGMQLLFDYSKEGNTDCLGVIQGEVLPFEDTSLKTTQIGWNAVHTISSDLLAGVDGEYFYYVNSYFVPFGEDYSIATSDYGLKFSAAVQYKNFYGCQFHPEKSGVAGERILKNFIEL